MAKEITLHAAMTGVFVMVLLAWPLGKWRAKVWLTANISSPKEDGIAPAGSGGKTILPGGGTLTLLAALGIAMGGCLALLLFSGKFCFSESTQVARGVPGLFVPDLARETVGIRYCLRRRDFLLERPNERQGLDVQTTRGLRRMNLYSEHDAHLLA